MTLVHTGKAMERNVLISIAQQVFAHWVREDITLTHAYVNSFVDYKGNARHDVLLKVGEVDAIEKSREKFIPSNDGFSMNDPHVTHGIYDTLAQAEQVAKSLNQEGVFFPYPVTVTGVTI